MPNFSRQIVKADDISLTQDQPEMPQLIIPSLEKDRKSIACQGFTLVELVMVVGIMAVLFAVALPLLGLAQREAKKGATRVVMAKVDTAIRLFRSEIGSYPWQPDYPDIANGAVWTNRLHYHIGSDISAAELDVLRSESVAAAMVYRMDVAVPARDPRAFWPRDHHKYVEDSAIGVSSILNSMASERARLAIFAGNTTIATPAIPAAHMATWPVAQRRPGIPTTPLLSNPDSRGWARDFLVGEIPREYRSGDAILDAWGRPLLYVSQVVEGVAASPSDGVWGYVIRPADYGMQALGRTTLAPQDALTGKPLTSDPVRLPDLSNLRRSDRRYYAPRGLELEFELWSAGPDGRADWMRDAAVNRDNVSLDNYDGSIP